MAKKKVIVKGFKGFDGNLKCKDLQYQVGETLEADKAELCQTGLHFCEYPLDCFNYYEPGSSRYCSVEAENPSEETHSDDSKRVTKKLTVKAELNFLDLAKASVDYTMERIDTEKTGIAHEDQSAATNTGYRSVATNTGYRSVATNTGNGSTAQAEGKESFAFVTGANGRASGALGCWIGCAECGIKNGSWHVIDFQVARVDGDKIKADTFYMLKNGEFVEE